LRVLCGRIAPLKRNLNETWNLGFITSHHDSGLGIT
jgi:hypothetical protein